MLLLNLKATKKESKFIFNKKKIKNLIFVCLKKKEENPDHEPKTLKIYLDVY